TAAHDRKSESECRLARSSSARSVSWQVSFHPRGDDIRFSVKELHGEWKRCRLLCHYPSWKIVAGAFFFRSVQTCFPFQFSQTFLRQLLFVRGQSRNCGEEHFHSYL